MANLSLLSPKTYSVTSAGGITCPGRQPLSQLIAATSLEQTGMSPVWGYQTWNLGKGRKRKAVDSLAFQFETRNTHSEIKQPFM